MPSIINSDDGQTSGSAGLKFTSADDGILQIQNNGNTAMTVSAAGQSTFTTPVSQPGAFMFRNKLINGNFDIWQRGTSQTASGYGSADRWRYNAVGSTQAVSRQSFTIGQTEVPNNPRYFSRIVISTAAGAGNYVAMQQRIETVSLLSDKTVTVSFWAKADSNKNIAVNLAEFFGTGGSPSATEQTAGVKFSLSSSWQRFQASFTVPSVLGKLTGSNNDDWVGVSFWFDAGSNNDSNTDSLGQQSGTFDIAQVQLEEGSAATPFEQRFYEIELLLCQRYCQTIGSRFTGSVENGTNYTVFWPTFINMRTNPSATVRTGHYFSARYNGTDVNIINPTLAATTALRNGVWALVASSGLTTYRPIQPRMQSNLLNEFLLLNAEL